MEYSNVPDFALDLMLCKCRGVVLRRAEHRLHRWFVCLLPSADRVLIYAPPPRVRVLLLVVRCGRCPPVRKCRLPSAAHGMNSASCRMHLGVRSCRCPARSIEQCGEMLYVSYAACSVRRSFVLSGTYANFINSKAFTMYLIKHI